MANGPRTKYVYSNAPRIRRARHVCSGLNVLTKKTITYNCQNIFFGQLSRFWRCHVFFGFCSYSSRCSLYHVFAKTHFSASCGAFRFVFFECFLSADCRAFRFVTCFRRHLFQPVVKFFVLSRGAWLRARGPLARRAVLV